MASDNTASHPDKLFRSVIDRAHVSILSDDPPDYAVSLCATGDIQNYLIDTYLNHGYFPDCDDDIEMFYPALHLNQSEKLKPMLENTVWKEETDGPIHRRQIPEGSWKAMVERYVSDDPHTKIARDTDWHNYCEAEGFMYTTKHESKFGLVRLPHLPVYINFMLKSGIGPQDLRWKIVTQIFEEFNPALAANKLCALMMMVFGFRYLRYYHKDLSACRPWCASTNEEFIKRAKAFTVAVRKYSINSDNAPLPKEAVVEAAYMEMASGRSENKFSLEDELKHRTAYTVPMMYPDEHGVWSKDAFSKELFKTCSEELREARYKPKFNSSRRFFMERAAWASSGASDKRLPWLDMEGRVRKTKVTKRVSVQNTTWNDIMEHIAKEPFIMFTISDKFECAKGRAILSSDDMHSFISHLIMAEQEAAVQNLPWAGHATSSGDGCRMLLQFQQGLRDGGVFLGTDWDDFNIHQSDYHQHAMARAVIEHHLQSTDWEDPEIELSLCVWWANSFMNQKLSIRDTIYQLFQGLGSGVRVTDYFNTLFNRSVWVMSEKLAMRLNSRYTRATFTRHVGDDTGAMFRTKWEAAMTYYCTVAIGAKMNLFKQLFSSEWCEMLRRAITQTGIYAFQNRALGNLQSPPTQRSEAITIASLVVSRVQALNELISRGYSKGGAVGLYEWIVYCGHMMPKVTRIHPNVVDLDLDLGGMGCYRGPYRMQPDARIFNSAPSIPAYREHIWHSFVRSTAKAYATTDLLALVRNQTTAGGARLSEDELVDLERLCDDKTKNDYQAAQPALCRKARLIQLDRVNGAQWVECYSKWASLKRKVFLRNTLRIQVIKYKNDAPVCQDPLEIFANKRVYMYEPEFVLHRFHVNRTIVYGITSEPVRQELFHMIDCFYDCLRNNETFAVQAATELGRMILGEPLTSVSDNPFMRFYRKVTNWGNLINTYTVTRACKADRMFAVKLISYMRDEDWSLLTGSAWNVDLLLRILEEIEDDSTIPAIFTPILGPSFCKTATHLIYCDMVRCGLSPQASTFDVRREAWYRGWALAIILKTMPIFTMMCLP